MEGYRAGNAIRWRILINRPGFGGGSNSREDGAMKKSSKFSPEVREQAVRLVQEHHGEYSVAVGGDRIHRTEDRLRAADSAGVGQAVRDGRRRPSRLRLARQSMSSTQAALILSLAAFSSRTTRLPSRQSSSLCTSSARR